MFSFWPSLGLSIFFLAVFLEGRALGVRATIPLRGFLAFFAYGCIGAPLILLLLQQIPFLQFDAVENARFELVMPAAWLTGPAIEEFAKLLPVLVLAFVATAWRRSSIVDLMLAGLASGAGFGFVESNLQLLVNGTSPDFGHLIGLGSAAAGGVSGDYAFNFAGHAAYTALFGLALGAGLRLYPVRFAYAWMPAAVAYLLACFDHGMFVWKTLHPGVDGGTFLQASGVTEFLYVLTLHGRLEIWLLLLGLVAAQVAEAWLCGKIAGKRPDLLLPCEFAPWSLGEGFAALRRLPQGRASFLLTLDFFLRRRSLAIAKLEASRNPSDRALGQHVHVLEQRLKREHAILIALPPGTWFGTLPTTQSALMALAWRTRWPLTFSILFVALFTVGTGTYPLWLKSALYGQVFAVAFALLSLGFAGWRSFVYLRLPRLDPVACEGPDYTRHLVRMTLFAAALGCGLMPVLSLLTGWNALASGAAGIGGTIAVWVSAGGNLYALMALAAFGGAIEGDNDLIARALRADIATGDSETETLKRKIAGCLARDASHATDASPGNGLGPLSALIAERYAKCDEQTARILALEEYERRAESTRADDIAQIFQQAKDEFERLQAALAAAATEQLDQIAVLTQSYERASVKIVQALNSYDTSHRNLGGLKRDTVRPQKQNRESTRAAEVRNDAPLQDLQAFMLNPEVPQSAPVAEWHRETEGEKHGVAMDAPLSAPPSEETARAQCKAEEVLPRSEPVEETNALMRAEPEDDAEVEPETDFVVETNDLVFGRPAALLTAAAPSTHQLPVMRTPSPLVVAYQEIAPDSLQAPVCEPLLLTVSPYIAQQLPARLAPPAEDAPYEAKPVCRLEAGYAPLLLPSVPHDARSLPAPFVPGWNEHGFENAAPVDLWEEVYDASFEYIAPIEIPEGPISDRTIESTPAQEDVSRHVAADDEQTAEKTVPASELLQQDASIETRFKIFDLPTEALQSAGKPSAAIGNANVLGAQAASARVLLANIETAVTKRMLEAKHASVVPLPVPGHDRLWNLPPEGGRDDWHFGLYDHMPDERERNSETHPDILTRRPSERRRLQTLGMQYQEASDRLGDETALYHLDFLDDGKLPPAAQIEEDNTYADNEPRETVDEAFAASVDATDVTSVNLETASVVALEIVMAQSEAREFAIVADIQIDDQTPLNGEPRDDSANTSSGMLVAEPLSPAIVADKTPFLAVQTEPPVLEPALKIVAFTASSDLALTPPLQAEAPAAKGWAQRFQTWTRRWLDAGDKPQQSETEIDATASPAPTQAAAIVSDMAHVEPERTEIETLAPAQLAAPSDAWTETRIEVQETLAASDVTSPEIPVVLNLMPQSFAAMDEIQVQASEPAMASAASERTPNTIEIPHGIAEQQSLDDSIAAPLEIEPALIDAALKITAVPGEPIATALAGLEEPTPQPLPPVAEAVSDISFPPAETAQEAYAPADTPAEAAKAAPIKTDPATRTPAERDAPEPSAPVAEAADALSILRETTEALIKLLGTEAVKTAPLPETPIPEIPIAAMANSLRGKDDTHTQQLETPIPHPASAPSVESDVFALDEIADTAPVPDIKPEKIEIRSSRIRSEKPRDKRVRSRTSGERAQSNASEVAPPTNTEQKPVTVKVVGRGKVIKQGNDKKSVSQPTPDNNSRRPAKFFNPGPETRLEASGADTLTLAKPAKAATGTGLAMALSDYYDKRGKPQPPMHTADAEAFRKIVGSGRLETPRRGPAPWSFSGLPRKGDYAIRLKPASEKFVEFIPSNVSFGQSPRFYPRTVGVGHYENFIPIEHLEYFDMGANRWVPLKP